MCHYRAKFRSFKLPSGIKFRGIDRRFITYSLTAAPVGASIDAATGLISWATSSADLGSHSFSVRVTDSGGFFDSQSFNLDVVADTQPPQVVVSATPARVNPDEPVTLTISASDALGVVSSQLFVGATPVALDSAGQAVVTYTAPGLYTVNGFATDAAGNVGSAFTTFGVVDHNDTEAPAVDITAPADNDTVTLMPDLPA